MAPAFPNSVRYAAISRRRQARSKYTIKLTASTIVVISLGIILSVLAALIYQFFVFAVDYTRTEYLQYEDDR